MGSAQKLVMSLLLDLYHVFNWKNDVIDPTSCRINLLSIVRIDIVFVYKLDLAPTHSSTIIMLLRCRTGQDINQRVATLLPVLRND